MDEEVEEGRTPRRRNSESAATLGDPKSNKKAHESPKKAHEFPKTDTGNAVTVRKHKTPYFTATQPTTTPVGDASTPPAATGTRTPPMTATGTAGSSAMTEGDMEIPDFIIWVKDEPLIFGMVSPITCSKLGITVLPKVADYCRVKEGFYPNISLKGWGHISRYKLQMPIDLAWSYYRLYDILTRSLTKGRPNKPKKKGGMPPSKGSWDAQCEKIRMFAADMESLEDTKVNTLQFLLFLYIQHHVRLHRKFFNRPLTSDEVWPSMSTISPRGSRPTSPASVSSKKVIVEQIHYEFLNANLREIIEFLCSVVVERSGTCSRVPIRVINALTLVIGMASIASQDREFPTFDEVVETVSEVGEMVGWDAESKTVDKERFVVWTLSNLKLNPWGPSSAPVPQYRVEGLVGVWNNGNRPDWELNRIFWNSQLYPKGWYLVSSVCNQVLHLDSINPRSSVKIHRCNNSFIYLPALMSSVIVEKCNELTLFLGPAAKVVKFVDCSKLTVYAPARLFIFCNVNKGIFHLLTPIQPIICGSKNRKIVLAPYNTFYPDLETHLEGAGLGVVIQKWNKPLELSSNGMPLPFSKGQGQSACTLLKADKFKNFVYPFEKEGKTFINPVELPPQYAERLVQMNSKMTLFKELVKSKNFDKAKKDQFEALVMARYKNWLEKTGKHEHILGLRSMQEALKQGSSVPLSNSQRTEQEAESPGDLTKSPGKVEPNFKGSKQPGKNGLLGSPSSPKITGDYKGRVPNQTSSSSSYNDRFSTVSEGEDDAVFIDNDECSLEDFSKLDSVFGSEITPTNGRTGYERNPSEKFQICSSDEESEMDIHSWRTEDGEVLWTPIET